ncbi:MAG: PEGA domain protein [Pelotomaculum sp. PtaB.Bin104]|nr:MAG: PEGA domain protein [Pelotomaculum sp. PtaB.Bin104]
MKKVSIRFIVTFLLLFSICLIGVAWGEVCNENENCPCPCSSSLKVYVYDMNTNTPIKGAAVEVSGPGQYYVKDYTGSKGSISISDGISLSGEYFVKASKEGYRSETISFTLEPDECKEFEFKIKLIPECTERNITASVYDTNSNNPINNAEVTLNGPNGYSSTQITDNNGQTTFDSLAEGSYTVSVSKTGYESESATVNADECRPYEIEIGLTPGGGDDEPCIEREIKVSVYDTDSNNPIEGAEVTLNGPDNYSSTKSTIEGLAAFDNLTEGSYTVSVSKTGYESESATVNADECRPFEIEIGLTPGDGDDEPCIEREIEVSVYDTRSNNPIDGADVTLNGPDNYSSTKSTSEGLATFDNLSEGSYTVSVSKTGYESKSATVEATECMPYEIEIGLTPGGGGDDTCTERSVTVAVYSTSSNNPVNGAEVTLNGSGNYSSTMNTTEGLVTFDNLSEGSYTVSVSKSGYTSESISVEATECKPYNIQIGLAPRNSGGGNNGGDSDNNDNPHNNDNPPNNQTPPGTSEPPSNNGNPPSSTPPEIDETPTPNTSAPPPVTTEPPPVYNEPPEKGDLPFTGANSLSYLLAGFVLCSIGVIIKRFDKR